MTSKTPLSNQPKYPFLLLFLAALFFFPTEIQGQTEGFFFINVNGNVKDVNGNIVTCPQLNGFSKGPNGGTVAIRSEYEVTYEGIRFGNPVDISIGTFNFGSGSNGISFETRPYNSTAVPRYKIKFTTNDPTLTPPPDFIFSPDLSIGIDPSINDINETVSFTYTGTEGAMLNNFDPASFTNCEATVTISVDGNLKGASSWHVYDGLPPFSQRVDTFTGNTLTLSPSASQSYFVCGEGNGAPFCSNECKSLRINVVPPPGVTISGGMTACPNEGVVLTAIKSGGAGTCAVQWEKSLAGQNSWSSAGPDGDQITVSSTVDMDYRAKYNCDALGCMEDISNIETVTMETVPPTITCPANIIQNNDQTACGATVTYPAITSSDNCAVMQTVQTDASGLTSGDLFLAGYTPQEYTVTDAAGNTASCSFTVFVYEGVDPIITCPGNMTANSDPGECGATLTYNVTSSDNCLGEIQTQLTGQASNTIFPIGTTSNTFLVTDASGNTASCGFDITVTDAESPTITCPASISQGNDGGVCGATITYTVTTDDNCPGETLVQTAGQASNTFFQLGTVTNSFTVTDASGQTASCSFTVNIQDDEVPVVTCPADKDVSNDAGECSAEVAYSISTSDNCVGETLAQTGGKASEAIYDVGTTVNTFEVTDASGNTSSCSFSITVHDDEDPTITCPGTINLSNDQGVCGAAITFTVGSSDNCSGEAVSQTAGQASGSVFPIGPTTNAFTVTDGNNNTATCSFLVTITDDEGPIISLLGADPVFYCREDVYVEEGATANDNCDGDVSHAIQIDASAIDMDQVGNYPVTYNVIDSKGNTAATVTRTVIVKRQPDKLAPQNCGSCDQIRLDFCEGEAAPDLEPFLELNANYEASTNFLWYADNSGIQGTAISTPIPNMASNNTRFYWVSQTLNDCEGDARRVRVRVRKTSQVVMDLPAQGCGAGQINLADWTSDSRRIATGFTFYDADPAGSASPLGSVTANKGQVNSGQYVFITLPGSPATYYATASNKTGCQVTGSDQVFSTAGASLNPVSHINANAGDMVQVSFISPDATQIIWYNTNNPQIGLIGPIGLGNISFTAQNTGATPLTANIRAIAYNGNCAGDVRDFTITVNPGSNTRQAKNQLAFNAFRLNENEVQLNWDIQYEFALTSIEMEKLSNDGEWEKIGESPLLNSTYMDKDIKDVANYRLKLIHADGRAIWSQEVEVNFDFVDNKRFTLYPNPTDGRFQLRAAGPLEGEWRYKLSDQLGRTILIGKLQGNETAFDISQLPTANYFLLLTSPEGMSYLQKVTKQ